MTSEWFTIKGIRGKYFETYQKGANLYVKQAKRIVAPFLMDS